VLTAVVIDSKGAVRVEFVQAGGSGEEKLVSPSECLFEPESEELKNADKIPQSECGPGPSPILPEMKELVWSGSAFIVFALLMRYFLYPRLRKGMDARYNSIREGHENADAARNSARSEVSRYEEAVAAAKADAVKVIEAARETLETERQARIGEVNARINAKREAAQREAEAARAAVRGQIESAVADVVTSAVEAATGARPDANAVSRAVADAMSAGVR
jgi:F-type H+-transporting ATPase subunit b